MLDGIAQHANPFENNVPSVGDLWYIFRRGCVDFKQSSPLLMMNATETTFAST